MENKNDTGMKERIVKAFIFDLDGVIVFTDKFHYQAWKKMADAMGIYFDEVINNRLRGVSRAESLEIILERYDGEPLSDEKKAELMEAKNNTYRELLATMTPADVTDEVRDTLEKLHEQGYRLAIGSSSRNAKFILEKVGLLDAFDAISDGNNITHSKPDPEVFTKAGEFLGVKPKECVVVEDAYAGIDAAKAAGMTAVGIGDAAGYAKADYQIESFRELLAIQG
ncbi:MAG: beta-phosphoglucomutase [Faecalicatena sp.]|uniref:beta-phosphoglucomutase n=1 Tax=Faecalicatena sp. TaxID=2005360 RepID=UPI0025905534|nr:beta-phosphoglucomutase [Faecalicatena sp.]MCI6464177.1 beta-phosphoglucomutase [Faecalicatena sp.]MDY5621143.1 beta-phosphoglucomutase [Lachnospiraceae bacterium]